MHCLDAKLSGVKSGQTAAKMLHGIEDSLFVVKGVRSSPLVLSDWLSLPFYPIVILSGSQEQISFSLLTRGNEIDENYSAMLE